MHIEAFPIEGPKLIRPEKIEDARGFFSEVYNENLFREFIDDVNFVQDNFSFSKAKGVIRGLHFQSPPFAQGKLVRVTRGAILDVAVDIRYSAPTFGEFVSVILSAENWLQLWVPPGFAHGFCTLEPNSEVTYKVTEFYNRDHDLGLAWDDPALGIPWPVDVEDAFLSEKDRLHPVLSALPTYFFYEPLRSAE
jgi:dTDP-4-dehydrorhamnose 3,5-epimerase